MNKDTLNQAVEACKAETKAALETLYNELNHGQQQKVIRSETVKALFERYGVEYAD